MFLYIHTMTELVLITVQGAGDDMSGSSQINNVV